MEDTHIQKMKELNWDPKQIKTANPFNLMVLLMETFDYFKERTKAGRGELPFHQNLEIEWGKWSVNFNKPLRERIKEHDLFIEKPEQRFMAKQCNIIYLCWWKMMQFNELNNVPVVIPNAMKMVKRMDEILSITEYFNNMNFKEEQTWVK